MADIQFKVQCIPDKTFWTRLADSPAPQGPFPEVMSLGNVVRFSYAPFNTLDGYTDWNNPERALHYVVPPTPSPIQMIGYLIAPQLVPMKPRRVFVAFYYGDGLAALAETHPMTMLHKPFGLRLASGIRYSQESFNVSPVVIKGDDAPIRIAMAGQNPLFAMSIYEGSPPEVPVNTTQTTPGQADTQLLNVLNIRLSIPGLASLGLNMPMPGIV